MWAGQSHDLKTTSLTRGEQVVGAAVQPGENDDFDLGDFNGDGDKYLESREIQGGKAAQLFNQLHDVGQGSRLTTLTSVSSRAQ